MAKDTKLFAGNALVGAFFLSVIIACLGNSSASLGALLIALLICSIYPPSWNKGRKTLAICNFFLLFLWLTTPLLTDGDTLWQWGIFNISRNGLNLCWVVTLKANAIMLIFLAVISPIPVTSIANAMSRLGLPDKLVWLLMLMSANIRIFENQWKCLWEAARLRAFQPRTNLASYKTIASLLAILLLRACEQARITREAMLLRGFNGRLPLLETWSMYRQDIFFYSLCLLSSIILILLDYGVIHV